MKKMYPMFQIIQSFIAALLISASMGGCKDKQTLTSVASSSPSKDITLQSITEAKATITVGRKKTQLTGQYLFYAPAQEVGSREDGKLEIQLADGSLFIDVMSYFNPGLKMALKTDTTRDIKLKWGESFKYIEHLSIYITMGDETMELPFAGHGVIGAHFIDLGMTNKMVSQLEDVLVSGSISTLEITIANSGHLELFLKNTFILHV